MQISFVENQGQRHDRERQARDDLSKSRGRCRCAGDVRRQRPNPRPDATSTVRQRRVVRRPSLTPELAALLPAPIITKSQPMAKQQSRKPTATAGLWSDSHGLDKPWFVCTDVGDPKYVIVLGIASDEQDANSALLWYEGDIKRKMTSALGVALG